MGTGGLSTQKLCQVVCMLHDANTKTATQDTTTLPSTSGLDPLRWWRAETIDHRIHCTTYFVSPGCEIWACRSHHVHSREKRTACRKRAAQRTSCLWDCRKAKFHERSARRKRSRRTRLSREYQSFAHRQACSACGVLRGFRRNTNAKRTPKCLSVRQSSLL